MPLLTRLYSIASRLRRAVAPRRTDTLTESSVSRTILGQERFVAMDLGAANGLLPHWQYLPQVATVYQVEPREDACRELEAINAASGYGDRCRILPVALSERGGDRPLYISNAPTGSSLLKIDPANSPDCARYVDLRYLYPIVETRMRTLSLGEVLAQEGEAAIHLIKLDIQGTELEVLRGLDAGRWQELLGIEIEVGLHDLYPKEAGFHAAQQLFEQHGLELFDVRVARVHLPRDGDHEHFQSKVFSVYGNSPTVSARIWEFDALFFRKRSLLLARGDPRTLRRMIIVYCTYNFFAEAYDLVDESAARGVFGEAEARELRQAIVDLHFVKHYRPWLADSWLAATLRRKAYAVAPRSAPRWCQYMYQNYPNG
jgi:FkbM family methyltransferase